MCTCYHTLMLDHNSYTNNQYCKSTFTHFLITVSIFILSLRPLWKIDKWVFSLNEVFITMIILVKMNLMNEIDKQNDYFYTCWPENFLSFLIILSLILLIILHSITYFTDHSAFYNFYFTIGNRRAMSLPLDSTYTHLVRMLRIIKTDRDCKRLVQKKYFVICLLSKYFSLTVLCFTTEVMALRWTFYHFCFTIEWLCLWLDSHRLNMAWFT